VDNDKVWKAAGKDLFLTNANPAACGIVSVFDRCSAWKLQYIPMNYTNPYLKTKARPFGNPGVQNLRVPVNVRWLRVVQTKALLRITSLHTLAAALPAIIV